METNQQHHPHPHPHHQQQQNEDNSGGAKGSFLCRQSSTRWTPTSDQIRILKDLYYNNGVRSPTADQIQRISARLRQYGKIEGKNVFYWFQNHKARERQKKRFNNDAPMQQRTLGNASANWKPEDYSLHNKYNNSSPGFASSCSSSAGIVNAGHMGTCGFGSVTMEKSFKDCSISATANCGVGHSDGSWVGINSHGYTFFDKRKSTNEALEEYELGEEEATPEIETLPLFPVHRESINAFCNIRHNPNFYPSNCYGNDDGTTGSRTTSLELSLKSYTGQAPDSI